MIKIGLTTILIILCCIIVSEQAATKKHDYSFIEGTGGPFKHSMAYKDV